MAITQTPAADSSAPSNQAALLDELKKLNFIRLAERNPSYDTLKSLGLDFLISVTGDKLAETKELKERQKTLGDTDPMMGKVLAATKDIYDEKVASGELPQGRSWSEFCEEKLAKKPDQMGRATQCMRCFRRLVMGGYLSEADYDVIATEWFTYTSKILDLATADGKEIKDSPAVQEVIAVLRTRPKDGAKRLRLIRNQLEGKDTVSQDGKGPELDEKNFLVILERGLAKGFHGIAMATLITASRHGTSFPRKPPGSSSSAARWLATPGMTPPRPWTTGSATSKPRPPNRPPSPSRWNSSRRECGSTARASTSPTPTRPTSSRLARNS
jgi:hypothetical protein